MGLHWVAWGSMKLHEVELCLQLHFIVVGSEIMFYCCVAWGCMRFHKVEMGLKFCFLLGCMGFMRFYEVL